MEPVANLLGDRMTDMTADQILAITEEAMRRRRAKQESDLDFTDYGDHNLHPRTGTCGHCGGTLGGCRC